MEMRHRFWSVREPAHPGIQEFTLDSATIASYFGQGLGLRLENTQLDGNWLSVTSSEYALGSAATLVLDYDLPSLTVSIQQTAISEADGTAAAGGHRDAVATCRPR